jgi:hypothetical protein
VADECAASLTGTLADRRQAGGVSVPIWAWTNLLAHGNRDTTADVPLELDLAETTVPFWSSRQWVNGATAERHRHDRTFQSS